MSDNYSGQASFLLEAGAKLASHWFVGGYFGLAAGELAGETQTNCQAAAADCSVLGVRMGVEIQYHLSPAQTANPWFGYGFGYEIASQSLTSAGHEETYTVHGFEYAHLMLGVDFRLGSTFGIGPVVDLALGSYARSALTLDDRTQSWSIEQTASHAWLTLGVRGSLVP